MAIYTLSVKNVPDADGKFSKPIMEYAADDISDINNLPGLDMIMGGSSVFIINAGQAFMLGKDNWRQI